MDIATAIILLLLIAVAIGGFYFVQRNNISKLEKELQKTSRELSNKKDNSVDAKEKLLQAEKEAHEIIVNSEKKARNIIQRAEEQEKRVENTESKLNERAKNLDSRILEIDKKESQIEQTKKQLKTRSAQITSELEKIAGLNRKQAEDKLMKELEEQLKTRISRKIHEAENAIQTASEQRAKEIVVDAMQRSATDFVAETTSTSFHIADEELKGKIIGKEGRNIRSFERLTGVDIIMDEAPDIVTVSSFDPIRREVAALSIQKLLKDGRVHPGSIEETVSNINNDLSKEIIKTGEKLAYDAGFSDLPKEVIKLLGRFKYRFSYGQNLAKHSMEMVNIGQQLAQEIGADINLTKKACLLHDIGKVLTYEIEGKPHHHISGDIVRKYIKNEKLANAVESHHGDIKPESVEAVLVTIADAISGARPGARRDNHEEYVKRIKALEDIAKQYEAVKEAYAIHAGREVRVIVKPDKISDDDTLILANKIATEIEEKENYPGTVKVTVIREVRIEAEAK